LDNLVVNTDQGRISSAPNRQSNGPR